MASYRPPPKLLNLNATTVRNNRTLVWLQNQSNTVKWSKWDAVVSNIPAYYKWEKLNTKIVGIIINEIHNSPDNFFDELFIISKRIPMILISQKILSYKSEDYWTENFDNVLNLDNILDNYPFIDKSWDGTLEDAIAIFSILCRYNRLVDCKVSDLRNSIISKWIKLEYNIIPNEVWIFSQFFKHKDVKRFKEIRECLIKNCNCPQIDKIILINEKNYANEWTNIKGAEKIQQIITGKRLTYSDFLKYVHDNVPNNIYTILCNADIYFDNSLLDLWKIDMKNRMLALLRWDVDVVGKSTIFGPRADSQDSWIFLSDSIKSRTWDYEIFNFQLGQAGCDNAFAGHIVRNRFVISNPALTFKTFHLHNTNIRNYDKSNYIKADIYINIAPTYIIDTKQETIPDGSPQHICNELVSFEIKSSSMSNEITYCTMLEKAGRYKWEPSVENYYFQPAIPVYSWKNSCVTPNGLVYDLYSIYKGRYANDENYNYWKSVNVDILTPLQTRQRMFAIPFKNTDVFKNPDSYILNYLSRCVRLLKTYPDTSFWIPKPFAEFINLFEWDSKQLNGAIFDENTACWANEVIGFLPDPTSLELGSEDIDALRTLLPYWKQTPIEKKCTVVISGAITQKFADEKIGEFLRSKNENWTVHYVYENNYATYDSIIGSSLCIFVGDKKENYSWTRLWALPKNTYVIEFQQELQIQGEFQHLAHVSGFKSWVLLLSKGPVNDVQEQIIEQLEKWWKKNGDDI
jgi:hypothetical protein